MASTEKQPAPAALFDPDTERPPRDALEVYLEPPVSLLVWMTALRAGPMRPQDFVAWSSVERWRAEATAAAVASLGRHANYVMQRWEGTVGLPTYAPARIKVTSVSHDEALGHQDPDDVLAVYRPHEHIYLSRHGDADDGSGRWPLDVEGVRHAALMAQTAYVGTFRGSSEELFRWRRVEDSEYDPGPPESLPIGRWDPPDPVQTGWEIDHPDVQRLLTLYLQRYKTNVICTGLGPVHEVILAGREHRNGAVRTIYGGGAVDTHHRRGQR